MYEHYLGILAAKNLISTDDLHNFKDVYPLFEPFYVTYDKVAAEASWVVI